MPNYLPILNTILKALHEVAGIPTGITKLTSKDAYWEVLSSNIFTGDNIILRAVKNC